MDIYRIAIQVVAQNGVSAVLAVIQKDVLKLHKSVGMTEDGFKRMRLAAIGALGVTAGAAMLHGLFELSKAGEKYTHQLEQMKLAGMSLAEQKEAIFAANRVSSEVRTTTPTENLQSIRELRGALNSAGASPAQATREAVEHLAEVQKAQAVMASSLGESHKSDVYEMVKALEDIGATKDPARFDRLLDGMVRSSITFGGKLTGKDFFQTLKYTRGAGSGYSDEFIEYYLPTLMQELKTGKGSGSGGGAGNPLASFFQNIVGGNISNKAAQEWARLHLIDPGKIIRTKTGNIKGIKTGGFYGVEEAIQNPYFYVRDHLMPALKAANITSPEAIKEELAHLFTNRVSQQMASLLMMIQKMDGDRKLTEATMHMDPAFAEAIRRDPVLTNKALTEQWDRIKTDIGKSITPTVTEATFQFARGLAKVAEIIERHPVATKYVIEIVAAVAGLVTVMGTLAIVAAGLGALGIGFGTAAGIAGIIAVIAGTFAFVWKVLSMVNWADMGASLRRGWAGIQAWVMNAAHNVGGWTSSFGRSVLDFRTRSQEWAAGMVRSLRDWVAGVGHGISDVMGAGKAWVSEIVTSLQADLLAVWTGLTSGLADLVRKLGAWFAAIPQMLWGMISGTHLPGMGQTDAGHGPTGSHVPGALPQSQGVPSVGMGPRPLPAPSIVHRSSYMPPVQQTARIENIMYLDGKVVYRNVVERMNKLAAKPLGGNTGFDPSMSPFLHGNLAST